MAEYPQRWGDYVLLRPLGSGGIGSVFLALTGQPGMEKLCVIKRLNADTLSNPERLARFRREADIVRTISHGGIAQTIGADTFDGEPFITQEFIEGRTLAQLASSALSSGENVPPLVAIYVAREVARALAYAYRVAGIVHRDIAPANVMTTFAGEVRLIDFGIARAGADPSLTAPGFFVGRASYTAPEVLAGKTADRRSDIYSLGVVLWELLVGRPPTFGELEARPPPSSGGPSLELPGVDAAVLQAIAPDPDERFASAEEFQRALGPLLPPNFVGDTSLADFIARCYDVETDRRNLRLEVLEASDLLLDVSPPTGSAPFNGVRRKATVVTAQPSKARRIPWGMIVGVLAGGAAILFTVKRHDSSPATYRPAAAAYPGASKWIEQVAKSPSVGPPAPPPPATAASSPRVVGFPDPVAAFPLNPMSGHVSRPARSPSVSVPAGVLLERARDNFEVGDLKGAQHDADEVLRAGRSSQKSRAHLIIGKVLVARGNKRAAADEFLEALRLDPQSLAAADELAQVRRRAAP